MEINDSRKTMQLKVCVDFQGGGECESPLLGERVWVREVKQTDL
jgi:hypothetical protein